MRIFKLTFIVLVIGLIGALFSYFFLFPPQVSLTELYEIEIPSKKEIQQIISATGTIKLKDQVKLGSVVNGRIKHIYVEENEMVHEDQLLAEVDAGVEDTEVREALGVYEKAMAELEYQEANFKTKKQLFEQQFLSDSDFREAKRDYLTTLADVKALKASYEKYLIAFENQKVYAPSSGIVIHVHAAKGEKVSSDIEGELFSLAPDIKQIEVELDISEKDIGQIEKGQKIQMVVDTFPNRIFESTVHHISFMGKREEGKECLYQAKAYLDNPQLLLRPGMSVNATINVATVDSALTVTSRAFLIKQEHLQPIAELLSFSIQPLDKSEKQALLKTPVNENVQFIWIACQDCFKEVPVRVGISDYMSFEIKSGLQGDEQLVVDVMETDEMQKIYESFYKKL